MMTEDKDVMFDDLDFKSILFRQLDRIGKNSNKKKEFNHNVTTLKLFLKPYYNKDFEEKIKNIEEDFNSENTGKIRKRNEYKYHQEVLAAVMELFDDKNLLFTRKGHERVNVDW